MSDSLVLQSVKTFTLQLGAKGRVVIPATLRQQLDLREGDRLVVNLEPDGSLRLVSLRTQVKKLRGLLKISPTHPNPVTELIEARQEEAKRE